MLVRYIGGPIYEVKNSRGPAAELLFFPGFHDTMSDKVGKEDISSLVRTVNVDHDKNFFGKDVGTDGKEAAGRG